MARNWDYSYSDMILMIGGQLLFVILMIMVLYFGVPPTSFPYAENVKKAVTTLGLNK
jgi:hypothetical protein